MGFEGILDDLEANSLPLKSVSKGIKNKNFDRVWVPRYPFNPDWLATWPPLIGWERAVRNYPPPLVYPSFGA